MIASTLLALALSLSADTKTEPKEKEPPKNFSFDTTGTSQDVQAGKPGTFRLQIKAAEGYHVSAEAPLKIGLTGEGLDLAKKQLGHDDAKDKKAASPEFTVGFGSGAAGAKTINVEATFFVCSEKLCERKAEKLSVPVSVRP